MHRGLFPIDFCKKINYVIRANDKHMKEVQDGNRIKTY